MPYIQDSLNKFVDLDPEIILTVDGDETVKNIDKVAQKNNVDTSPLSMALIFLATNDLTPDKVAAYLEDRLETSAATARKIAADFNAEVVDPLRKRLEFLNLNLDKKMTIAEEKTILSEMFLKNLLSELKNHPIILDAVNHQVFYVLDNDPRFRDELVKLLLANDEPLTGENILVGGKSLRGTVGNWLKNFIEINGSNIFNSIVSSNYLSSSKGVAKLSQEEKEKIGKILSVYRNLKFFPDSMPDETGLGWRIFPFEVPAEEKLERAKENIVAAPEKPAKAEEKVVPPPDRSIAKMEKKIVPSMDRLAVSLPEKFAKKEEKKVMPPQEKPVVLPQQPINIERKIIPPVIMPPVKEKVAVLPKEPMKMEKKAMPTFDISYMKMEKKAMPHVVVPAVKEGAAVLPEPVPKKEKKTGSFLGRFIAKVEKQFEDRKVEKEKAEWAKAVAPKAMPPKVEPAKSVPSKVMPPKIEPVKVVPPKAMSPKFEPAKVILPKIEMPKPEAPKIVPPVDKLEKEEKARLAELEIIAHRYPAGSLEKRVVEEEMKKIRNKNK